MVRPFHLPYIKVYDHPKMDLQWLADHQKRMLFPYPNSNNYAAIVQIADQERYCKEFGIKCLMTGRRVQDGNFCGRDDSGAYTKNGVVIYNPIRNYTHEQVIAVLRYMLPEVEMPPVYRFHDGFNHSAAIWPNWIKTPDKQLGWRLIYDAEPKLVLEASKYIASAKEFLTNLNS